MNIPKWLRWNAGFVLAVGISTGAHAADDFYKDHPIRIIVGSSAGGGYDTYARLLSRYLSDHVPGKPAVIIENMPGASGVQAINYIYNIAPHDGSVIEIGQRAAIVDPIYSGSQVKIDARRLSWIGGLNTEWSVGIARVGSGLDSLETARQQEFPVSSSGVTSDGYVYAVILNNVLGTKFRLITGYPGTAEEQLALERGEVAGRIGWAWGSVQSTARNLLDSGKIKPIVQLSPKPIPGVDAPLVGDLAANDLDRQVLEFSFAPQLFGRPFFGPPDLPADRLSVLQKAFDETAHDRAFLEEAAKANLEISFVAPDELQRLANELYSAPKDIVDRAIQARKYHM